MKRVLLFPLIAIFALFSLVACGAPVETTPSATARPASTMPPMAEILSETSAPTPMPTDALPNVLPVAGAATPTPTSTPEDTDRPSETSRSSKPSSTKKPSNTKKPSSTDSPSTDSSFDIPEENSGNNNSFENDVPDEDSSGNDSTGGDDEVNVDPDFSSEDEIPVE